MKTEKKQRSGGMNLVILGVVSVGIAVLTTVVSVFVYYQTGDIYIDRSRPGFSPDEDEIEGQQTEEVQKFSDTGGLTEEDVDWYLEHFKSELDSLDKLKSPYGATPLSDGSLGIPKAE